MCLPLSDLMGPFLYRGGLVGIDLACAILILAIVDGRWIGRWLFELKPFVALGLVSYGFYLWHLPVFYAVRYFDPHWNDVVRVVVAMAGTLALTLLSWFLLEKPMMNWKNRLEDRRRRSVEPSQISEINLVPCADAKPPAIDDSLTLIEQAPGNDKTEP